MANRASEPCRGASGRADEASSSVPIAQCNCEDRRVPAPGCGLTRNATVPRWVGSLSPIVTNFSSVPADAIVVGGASFDTINKWAAEISDTLVLGLLTEGIGLGLPLAALPFLNAVQAAHPGFGRSVKELRDAGVKVLLGSEGYEPRVPRQGSKSLARYP
jgi:hypothetical protein